MRDLDIDLHNFEDTLQKETDKYSKSPPLYMPTRYTKGLDKTMKESSVEYASVQVRETENNSFIKIE